MTWFLLALICAFSLASADAVTKRWLGDLSPSELVIVRLGLVGILLLPILLPALAAQSWPVLPLRFWLLVAVLVPLELAAMWLYMKAIQGHALAETLPYLAFTPVLVTLTGWLLLDEQVSGIGLSGILLVVGGSWLLNFDGRWHRPGDLIAPFRRLLTHPGSRLMLVVAAIYSLTSVGSKAAMAWLEPLSFAALYFGLVGLGAILLIGAHQPRALRALRPRSVAVWLVAILMAVMVISHFAALERVETAYMIAVKRSSLLFGILYGAWWFGERHLGRHLISGGLMVVGVTLIVLGTA